ncbi:aminotransferase class IV [Adhaeribacter sp. BT258]|uniref:branched-chain-amino-acid transaminase n=1 Tax=Adhaeribacter terrigena TaxID=2793070 RepID=A0ABS1C0H7_9BACT|nr:aminotransferase class IV [Adhaeribacter terrigena]MBK0402909.1 aminotransferase class IV [Adhaeribacter terrigena]
MKYVLYNFELKKETALQIPICSRAFQYNDGAFETMLFSNGKVRFLDSHLNRLDKAAKVLHLELPDELSDLETLGLWLEKLIWKNQLKGSIRLKLKFWRSGKGLYTPEQNAAEVLITAEPQHENSNIIQTAGFAETVCTHYSSYSFFKGPNSTQYVLSGIEKKQRNLDEIILLSAEGFVSECLAANIFWIRNGMVFTPKTTTGCIAGVMRENLLRLFQSENIAFQEGAFLPEALLKAEVVFTSNAAGIRTIESISETKFAVEHPIIMLIREKLINT